MTCKVDFIPFKFVHHTVTNTISGRILFVAPFKELRKWMTRVAWKLDNDELGRFVLGGVLLPYDIAQYATCAIYQSCLLELIVQEHHSHPDT